MSHKTMIQRSKLIQSFEEKLTGHANRLFVFDAQAIYGSGKTTLLNQLFSRMEEKGEYLPIEPFSVSEELGKGLALKEKNENRDFSDIYLEELRVFLTALSRLGKMIDAKAGRQDFSDFEYIFAKKINDLDKFCKGSLQKQQITQDGEAEVCVSYKRGGESERIVNVLEQAFAKYDIRITRDIKDIDYKGSIQEFEQRIGRGQCIIVVISNGYLCSEHCMYELVEAGKNQGLRQRIFPIVLADAQIYHAVDRMNYIDHWENQIERLDQRLKDAKTRANLTSIHAALDKYTAIRASFDHLTDLLSDMNALTSAQHEENDFSTIINAVVEARVKIKTTHSQNGSDNLHGITTESIKEIIGAIIQGFRERVMMYKEKKLIFFIDDFCYIIDQQIGKWFLELLENLENIIFVIARTVTGSNIPAWESVVPFPLAPFEKEEIAAYLAKSFEYRLGVFVKSEDLEYLAASIHKFSAGHPGTSCLAADTIQLEELSDINKLVTSFDEVSKDFAHHQGAQISKDKDDEKHLKDLTKIYDELLDRIFSDFRAKDPDMEEAINIGSIVPRFDADLFRALVDKVRDLKKKGNLKSKNALLERLTKYSFVQRADDNNKNPQYAFHNFVRDRLEEKLQRENEPRDIYYEIHRLAKNYYMEKLADYENTAEESIKTAYSNHFWFEDNFWQEWMIEIFYHRSFSKEEKPDEIRLSFVNAYFNAFNWWEWYLPSPLRFCDRLLELWEKIAAHKENSNVGGMDKSVIDEIDKSIIDDLRTFAEQYPKEYYYHKRGKGDWGLVKDSLSNVRVTLGIDEKPEETSQKHERNLYGMTAWFLGQSYHYHESPDFVKTEKHYKEAREMFELNKDSWNLLWADMYLAELYLARGDYQVAIEKAEQSLRNATTTKFSKRDHEVICQNYRILGDIYRDQGKLDLSFRDYARSVFHAYVYNAYPNPPDNYTEKLHLDICHHVANEVLKLWEHGMKQQAFAAIDFLHQNWKYFWRRTPSKKSSVDLKSILEKNEVPALLNYLFPPPPDRGDMGKITEYTKIVRAIVSSDGMKDDMENLPPAPISA